MKFAAIIPPSGLRVLERVGLGYHLVLAQELLRDKEYREYYKILGRLGHFIIVDNGAAERDQPPFKEVVAAARYISASEIVMPDIVLDRQATLDALLQAAVLDLVPARKRFIVPQGRTPDEWVSCLDTIHKQLDGNYSTIGLSKYHHNVFGGRAQLLTRIPKYIRDTKHIHVLGIATADPFQEVKELAAVGVDLRAVDTAAPVAYAQRVRKFPDPVPTGDHISVAWDAPFDLDLARENVLSFTRFVSKL